MTILANYTKQPADVQDYDIDYSEYLDSLEDTALTAEVEVEPGITLEAYVLLGSVVKVWLSGGEDGERYKVTARVVTTGGRTKESEIRVRVKEV